MKILVGVLCLGLIVESYFLLSRPTQPTSPATHVNTTFPASLTIPGASLEKAIKEKVADNLGDYEKILLYDANSNLVFVQCSTGIVPVLTNKEFTEFKKFIFPLMDFQEFREEATERGPLDWRVKMNAVKDFSIIYGFAEDRAKTIQINSEGNVLPNKCLIRDNLWFWYATFEKNKIKLPVTLTVYDESGKKIYNSDEFDPEKLAN